MEESMKFFLFLCSLIAQQIVLADHAITWGAPPKYPAGFSHFDYVNPNAPVGGTLVLATVGGNFDSLNPYLLKGIPADGLGLLFDTLMASSMDESLTSYGLLAEDATLSNDKLSITFRLNPKATFSNNKPVTAEDVKFSFETLMSEVANPHYRVYWADVKDCQVLDERTVRFNFKRVNRELHVIIGQMPVFSKDWLEGEDFSKAILKKPIASGRYLIDSYDLGKNITYKRNSNYWGKDLNVNKGMYNFEYVKYKYYQDITIALEALKAGDFDFMDISSSKQWATEMKGAKFDSGELKKTMLKHRNNSGMQAFVFNLRKPFFKEIKVRQAINLAYDFEWANENLFYKQYKRCDSYFSNSELAAPPLPSKEELQLLEPFREQLPNSVFTKEWTPVNTNPPNSLRNNLIQAKQLLEEAGWKIPEGQQFLKNKQGEELRFTILLAEKAFERIVAPFVKNLMKLGIQVDYRIVDPALYKQRIETFNYDMIVASFPQSQMPGNEQIGFWHSSSAKQNGSRNYIGLENPVVDALVDEVIQADNKEDMKTAIHALDRVLLHGEYIVPNWFIDAHRVVYRNKFAQPEKSPLYYHNGESVLLATWWIK
jgi:microcin C transport system substrate-binding protein